MQKQIHSPEVKASTEFFAPYCAPESISGAFRFHEAPDDFETVTVNGKEWLLTPIDEYGLPYCFAPTVELPPVKSKPDTDENGAFVPEADLNHMFPIAEVVRSTSPAVRDDPLARAALIGARVQWVDYEQHHYRYNSKFLGPRHASTKPHLSGVLTLCEAGYIPERAIDLSGTEPKIVGLRKKERKWLWTSGQVDVRCHSDLQKYLFNYVLDTNMDHIDHRDVEDFFYTFDYEKKLKLGKKLASLVLERAAEPLEQPYREARKKDLLTFVRVGSYKKAPPPKAQDLLGMKLRVEQPGSTQSALITRLAQITRRPRAEWEASQAA